jgi:hypothetical protein
MILALLAAGIGLTLLARRRRGRREDAPTWILRTATRALPADRVEWGDARLSELAAIRPGWPRWRFSLSTLRVTLFPPYADARPVWRWLLGGLTATAAVGGAALLLLPVLAQFLTILTAGVAAAGALLAARSHPTADSLAQRAVVTTAVAAITAVTALLIVIAVGHPAAAGASIHPLTILLALAMPVVYLAARAIPAGHANTVWLTSTIAALAATGASAALAIWHDDTGGVHPAIWPPTLIACGASWAVVRLATGSTAAARHTGLLSGAVTATTQLAVAVAAIAVHRWGTGPGSPAADQISDALSGQIIANIIAWPALMAVACLAARAARPPRLDTAEPR